MVGVFVMSQPYCYAPSLTMTLTGHYGAADPLRPPRRRRRSAFWSCTLRRYRRSSPTPRIVMSAPSPHLLLPYNIQNHSPPSAMAFSTAFGLRVQSPFRLFNLRASLHCLFPCVQSYIGSLLIIPDYLVYICRLGAPYWPPSV